MKISVSLPEADVRALDDLVRREGLTSRSAALHLAIERLRESSLTAAYVLAIDEWTQSKERAAWDATVGDGMTDEAW